MGFGAESNMVVDFQLYYSSLFGFIDENGHITDIEEEYNEEVKTKLLDILLIN